MIISLICLASCVPSGTTPRTASSAGTTDSTTAAETLYDFEGEKKNFIYSSGTRNFGVQTATMNSDEGQLLWGNAVQTQIKNIPDTTKVCLLFPFKTTTPNRILALSGVRKRQVLSQTTTSVKATYYWLFYPDDSARNQQDCLTTGIINTKNAVFGNSATLKFSLAELCTDCTTGPQSESLQVYTNSGGLIQNLDTSSLKLKVQLNSNSTGSSSQSCSSNSACAAIGFNCCLEGQCVNDKAVRNGVDQTLADFLSAVNDVTSNPAHYKNYPQYFYLCPTVVNTTPGGNDATDPDFQALQLLNEKTDLYNCINPKFDEISYCSIRYPKASVRINSALASDKLFNVSKADNNFRWTGNALNANSIYALRYGEVLLYQEDVDGYNNPNIVGSHALQGSGNGDLLTSQVVQVTKVLPSSAKDDTLVVTYKVDGTCEKLSTSLARCKKTYVQGQVNTPPRPTDHATSNTFALPSYANTDGSFPPSVKVSGTNVASEAGVTWVQSGSSIVFTMAVNANQTVEIIYYVTTNIDALVDAKTTAQARINELCGCSGTTYACNLTPKTQSVSGVATLVDYSCVIPGAPDPDGPLFKQVLLSSKTVPSRHFDSYGTVWDGDSSANAPNQEGMEFKYTSNDPLQPNNVSTYIGFHEIYGSFNKATGAPSPPSVVDVKKGESYDIYVNSGGFSSCDNCGNDPYLPTLKLFPITFAQKGAGFYPDLFNTSRRSSTGVYRADDLLFGRACFVPATMIPWTHATGTTAQQQRQRRLAAQHFLYSNGYNRDWFGFDYGSVIGSFDGVTWFSIGSQRHIQATSNKLFLAVNAYFGDKTVDDIFKVTINGSLNVSGTGSTVTHDTLSTGAECQKSHYCSTDDDCIRQLGYEYSCQNVTGMTTPWPIYDVAGNESIGSKTVSIASLVNGTNGQARRCVYRGRGAPCETNLNSLISTYNGVDTIGLAACAPNNYCASVDGAARFNTSIARFGSSPAAQNSYGSLGTKDIYGLGARYIGRPFDYYGTRSPASVISTAWGLNSSSTLSSYLKNSANVEAICIPGKNMTGVNSLTTYGDLQSSVPSASDKEAGDRMFGVGATVKLSSSTLSNESALAMCPTTSSGTYTHLTPGTLLSAAAGIATAQNIPTSIYDLAVFSGLGLFNTSAGTPATTLGYQRYACLRAAGSACFSDLECAPSEFVATKMKTLSAWGALANNPAEQAFLKEELICGNPEPQKLYSGVANTLYDIKANKCCRELGKTSQVYTQFDTQTNFLNCLGTKPAIAGVNLDYNSPVRNTRNHTIFDKATCVNPSAPAEQAYPALTAPTARCMSGSSPAGCTSNAAVDLNTILNQYKTLDLMNSRTCCTGHWVRSFASENGGGHTWGSGKAQSVDKAGFYAWDWYYDQKFTTLLESNESEKLACASDNFGSLACEIRSLSDTQANTYLKWIDRFELVGIPQVLIPFPSANTEKLVDSNQASLEGARHPLDNTLLEPVTADVSGSGNSYVSAASYGKMSVSTGKLKKVFSESEFNCCVPAGGSVPKDATASTCCTGTLTDSNGALRCCLGDFSDVTVYLNRYVSSEGRGLDDSMYDKETGYIKDPGKVLAMAQARNLCCSGKIVPGVAIHNLLIPLQGGTINQSGKSRRFVYRSDSVDNNSSTGAIGDIYDAGLRWNNHYYCAPSNYTEPTN